MGDQDSIDNGDFVQRCGCVDWGSKPLIQTADEAIAALCKVERALDPILRSRCASPSTPKRQPLGILGANLIRSKGCASQCSTARTVSTSASPLSRAFTLSASWISPR